jgi:phosphoribosylamine--glycine ligase/phosphoribosylformylglycinamidine cyclo-ligase
MVIVGPEQPLVDGITDTLKKHGIACFGPSAKAAVIESSKVHLLVTFTNYQAFSKDFMQRHNIPTAQYKTFTNYDEALSHLNSVNYSVVLKASGLAAGKGVLIPESKQEALDALKTLMVTKPFGTASDQIVIEERLQGPEVSGNIII